jgi:hypothetical protein
MDARPDNWSLVSVKRDSSQGRTSQRTSSMFRQAPYFAAAVILDNTHLSPASHRCSVAYSSSTANSGGCLEPSHSCRAQLVYQPLASGRFVYNSVRASGGTLSHQAICHRHSFISQSFSFLILSGSHSLFPSSPVSEA